MRDAGGTTERRKLPQCCYYPGYSLFESKKAVVSFLERHDPEFAVEVKARLAYLDRYETGFEYADAIVNGTLSRVAGHIADCLTKIQARLQWGSDKYSCSEVERLSAEQNCEIVIAADEVRGRTPPSEHHPRLLYPAPFLPAVLPQVHFGAARLAGILECPGPAHDDDAAPHPGQAAGPQGRRLGPQLTRRRFNGDKARRRWIRAQRDMESGAE